MVQLHPPRMRSLFMNFGAETKFEKGASLQRQIEIRPPVPSPMQLQTIVAGKQNEVPEPIHFWESLR